MKTLGRLTILLVVFLLTPSLVVGADTPSGAPPSAEKAATPAPPDDVTGSRTFGVASVVSYTIGGYAFDPANSASTYVATGGTGDRHFTSAGGFFLAPVNLPAGALISSIEIQGCDTSAAGELTATLFSNTTSGGGVQSIINHGSVSTGVAAAPGCGFFAANFGTPPEVDNLSRTYFVQVTHGTTDGSNRFSAVRLFYVLQVSPAPAAATFTDVPTTHGFFRFIQALAAAGITGGCGPALYCPDDPVTRGQMAVFISRALGLHFAP